jgi:thioredoxin-related protein
MTHLNHRLPLLALILPALLGVPGIASAAEGPELTWITAPYQAKQEALASQRLWLMYFHAPDCPHAQNMSREVWPDPRVRALAGEFLFQSVERGEVPSMYNQYDVQSSPTLVVADYTGRELVRMVGYPGLEAVVDLLTRLARDREPLNAITTRLLARPDDARALAEMGFWYLGMGMPSHATSLLRRAARLGRAQEVPEDVLQRWGQAAQSALQAAKAAERADTTNP